MGDNDTRVLAVDVGAGTQDILVHQEGIPPENNVKLVVPSQTVIVGRRIRGATAEGKDIFLVGSLMGGGASSDAIRDHLAAGMRVYATPQAAKTVRDDLAQVRAMGVIVTDESPSGEIESIATRDVDLQAIGSALGQFGVSLPERRAIAVQDHGECFTCGQREFRFRMWRSFLAEGGRLIDLAYALAPPHLTRMRAVQMDVPSAVVMDTAGAAIWGALEDPRVAAHRAEGLTIVNIGNEHTLGVLVRGERVFGLFEHHTSLVNATSLADHVDRLMTATLTHQEVYGVGGHGCEIHPDYRSEGGNPFGFVALTGPNWALADGLGYRRAAPHGDMMIAGCFGLVAAARHLWRSG